MKTGQSETVFKKKDRLVTDAAIFVGAEGGARAFLAAVEPPGQAAFGADSRQSHGCFRALILKDWVEMPVDYRAVAQSLVLAGPDAEHLWAATDTGMILRLSLAAR